jgi:hypothetical protein
MVNENLQILHIYNPFFSLSLLSLLSFFSKSFFLFPALILLFVVPRHSHGFFFRKSFSTLIVHYLNKLLYVLLLFEPTKLPSINSFEFSTSFISLLMHALFFLALTTSSYLSSNSKLDVIVSSCLLSQS